MTQYSKSLKHQMTEQEEEALWATYAKTKDDVVRNKIVMQYADLVETVVKKMYYAFQGKAQIEDVVSNGMITLIKAVESYDYTKGAKFATYASLRIKGSVIDYMRSQDWIPRTIRERTKAIESVYACLREELQREPTNKEVAEKAGITEKKLEEYLVAMHTSNMVSIEELVTDRVQQAGAGNQFVSEPQLLVQKKETAAQLAKAIDELTDKERLVITLFYYEELKAKEIAQVLDITPSRVSQLHSMALIKIKNRLNDYVME